MPIIDQTKLPKEITDKYSVANNAFRMDKIKNSELDLYTNSPKDLVTVEIGDTKQPDFFPQLKLARWGNNEEVGEVNFSLRLIDDEVGQETVNTLADKIVWEKGNKKIEFYDFAEGEGGYKLIPYLKKKPKTNQIKFSVKKKGLEFYKQPPLTQEYQNGYSEEFKKEIVVTETQVKDLDGNILAERPIEAVNSYAIYHSTKGGMVDKFGKDYKTGKAFHDFRPHFFDANGMEAWGDIDYIWTDAENGERIVTIPQEFLDTAVYPIKSNDTFGYTTGGASDYGSPPTSALNLSAARHTAGVNESIVSFSAYAKSQNGSTVTSNLAAYTYVSADPATRLSTEATITVNSTTVQWWTTGAVSQSLTNGVNYCVAIGHESHYNFHLYYDSTATKALNESTTTYLNPMPSTWTRYALYDQRLSIYATYTPSGGGGVNTPSTLSMLGVGM